MERTAEGPKKLNVLYGSRHIRSTRSGCPAADAKLYPVFAHVVGGAPDRRLSDSSAGIGPLVAAQSAAGHLRAVLDYCVPFATIVVGRFAHFALAIWRHAGHMALIAAVGLRLVLIAPHLKRATICVIGGCRRSC
jgi:hypothetical protein